MITPSARLKGPLGLALAALISSAPGVVHAAPPRQGEAPQMLPIEARWCPHRTTATTPTAPTRRGNMEGGCVALEVPRSWHQYALGLQRRPA